MFFKNGEGRMNRKNKNIPMKKTHFIYDSQPDK